MPLSLVFVAHPARIVLDTVAVLVAGGFAESRLGRRKTVLTALVCGIGGVAVGLLASVVVNGRSPLWQRLADLGVVLGPLCLAVGPLMAASAFETVLWRRRIRLIAYAVVGMFVLYRGETGDWCALAAAVLGHVVGYLMVPRQDTESLAHATMFEARRIIACLGAVMALGPVIAVSSPIHAGPLSTLGLLMGDADVDPDRLRSCLDSAASVDCFAQYRLLRVSMPGSVLVSFLPVLFLLAVAYGLYRGRRIAARVALAVNGAIVVLSSLYFLVLPMAQTDGGMRGLMMHGAVRSVVATAVPSLLCIAVVLAWMRCFRLRTRPRVAAAAGGAVLASLLALAALYVGLAVSHPRWFAGDVTVGSALADLPARFLPLGFLSRTTPDFVPTTLPGRLLYQGVGPVLWIVLIAALLVCLTDRAMAGAAPHAQASHLVELGGGSLSFMATWAGNSYWFSPSGRSAVAYRVAYGVALTCAGPFGNPAEADADLRDFALFCSERSWTPVFYSIHRPQRDALVARGWETLDIGTEMVVDPRAWQTRGRKWQDVRTAINKARRSGMTDRLATWDTLPADVRAQIVDISEQWVGEKALPEMRFTLGGVEELRDPRVRILAALDAGGRVQGVTSWLPTWRDGRVVGWTLDFMRHRPDSANGVMEFLIARMAERLRDEGDVEFMSLSAAPLAGIGGAAGADGEAIPPAGGEETSRFLTHVLEAVADLIEPAYGFHSLYRFKEKFQPDRRGVYLAYPDSVRLMQVALAVVHAYLPGMRPRDVLAFVRAIARPRR